MCAVKSYKEPRVHRQARDPIPTTLQAEDIQRRTQTLVTFTKVVDSEFRKSEVAGDRERQSAGQTPRWKRSAQRAPFHSHMPQAVTVPAPLWAEDSPGHKSFSIRVSVLSQGLESQSLTHQVLRECSPTALVWGC